MNNIDFEKVRDIGNDLIAKMCEKFPGANYTVFICAWQDDTFQVVCRNGKPTKDRNIIMRDFKWYDGNIEYMESDGLTGKIL